MPNIVGNITTARPCEVASKMKELIDNYNLIKNITLEDIAKFHADFEKIHPFQDGNGRVGRIIIFKECLKNNLIPVVIEDNKKYEYYKALEEYQINNDLVNLKEHFINAQNEYYESIKDFVMEFNDLTNRNK